MALRQVPRLTLLVLCLLILCVFVMLSSPGSRLLKIQVSSRPIHDRVSESTTKSNSAIEVNTASNESTTGSSSVVEVSHASDETHATDSNQTTVSKNHNGSNQSVVIESNTSYFTNNFENNQAINKSQAVDTSPPNLSNQTADISANQSIVENSTHVADANQKGSKESLPNEANQSPIERNTARVAVCLTGNLRTFIFSIVQNSIRENITEVINRTHDVDMFFNVRFKDTPARGFHNAQNLPTDDEIRGMINSFNPVKVRELTEDDEFRPLVDQAINYENREIERPSHCLHSSFTNAKVPNGLYRHAQCEELISEYEKEHNFEYKYVYITRPDMIFFDPVIPPHSLERNTLYTSVSPNLSTVDFRKNWMHWHPETEESSIPSLSDQELIGERDVIRIVSQAYNMTANCDLYDMSGVRNPEAVLTFWAMKNRLRLWAEPWLHSVVRFREGIECVVFYMISLPDEERKRKMDERCTEVNKVYIRPSVQID